MRSPLCCEDATRSVRQLRVERLRHPCARGMACAYAAPFTQFYDNIYIPATGGTMASLTTRSMCSDSCDSSSCSLLSISMMNIIQAIKICTLHNVEHVLSGLRLGFDQQNMMHRSSRR